MDTIINGVNEWWNEGANGEVVNEVNEEELRRWQLMQEVPHKLKKQPKIEKEPKEAKPKAGS